MSKNGRGAALAGHVACVATPRNLVTLTSGRCAFLCGDRRQDAVSAQGDVYHYVLTWLSGTWQHRAPV